MFLYGKNSVLERLRVSPKTVRKIILQDNFHQPEIEKLININSVPVETVSLRQLAKIKAGDNLQGIVAKVDQFQYLNFDDILSLDKAEKDTLIFLDRIFDPHNLGAIIRTAACFGKFAVVIPKFRACAVNDTVLHVASGGENYVAVSMVSNISKAIIEAKKCGYWILGAVLSDDAQDINHLSLPFPLGLVLGSEGGGLRYGVDKHLDIKARIPMEGVSLSFNVSLACAIFCNEISKQRK